MPHIKINQPNVSIFGSTVEIDGKTIHGVKSIDYHASVDDNETPVVTLGIRPKSGFELDAESVNVIEEFPTIHDAVLVLKKSVSEDSELRKAFLASIESVLNEDNDFGAACIFYCTATDGSLFDKHRLAEKILDRLLGDEEQ